MSRISGDPGNGRQHVNEATEAAAAVCSSSFVPLHARALPLSGKKGHSGNCRRHTREDEELRCRVAGLHFRYDFNLSALLRSLISSSGGGKTATT